MSRTTIYLSRLIGLFIIAFVACLFLNHDFANLLFTDRALLLMLSMMAVAAGLAMVLSHNVWSGGAPTIVVTLVGWLLLLKGITLLVVPDVSMMALFDALHVQQHLDLFLIVPLVLGLYLTYSGFKARLP